MHQLLLRDAVGASGALPAETSRGSLGSINQYKLGFIFKYKECAQLLERLWKEDQRQIEELKQHIEVVLGDESGSPGSPGSPIQGQRQGQRQRQARS